ncbi:GSH1 [[Candida] subhashii]|uniref:Glutamate--cysteine ligase n=1 Tax=[Candida] subhashii TaxID=561895 RepID=A0A8J5QEX3_9ASCO|nr:GSH1 [[Candida] subhashii]KAG7660450.1 GSH1 [[Candida] subhashii]
MGLLSLGTPLDWHQSKQYNDHVRYNGITQLINIFKQHSNTRTNDKFLWGDEVEYMMVDIDRANKTARLSIDKDYILDDLNDMNKSLYKALQNNVSFHPEYGRFMLEATPAKPYDGDELSDYVYVETNMKFRRQISEAELPENVKPLTITSYPLMGIGNFTSPIAKPIGPASQSLFLPDEIINRHARFPTLTANIRKRRGHKVAINLPMYPDKYTKLLDDTIPLHRDLFKSDKEPRLGASKPGHVYMDSMGFGMGASCLQITMQTKDINEARYLYDTLVSISPIMLSLSAAAPIFKGFLVNQDVRWNVVSGAVDDRTFIERDVVPYLGYSITGGLDVDSDIQKINNFTYKQTNEFGEYINLFTKSGKSIQKMAKSRYDSVANYLSDSNYSTNYYNPKYNDLGSPMNKPVYDRLMSHPLFDHEMARHFAYLFIRDPLVIFNERIDQNNELENDHFENIQSTNWQTLRFKPPALYDESEVDINKTPGWRVEFRPMEIQITDFENAAYSIFLALLSKAIIKFTPNFYIPLSKVDENMLSAHKVDSVLNDKFWFKSFENWNLDHHEFMGYDFSWFERYCCDGNDGLADGQVYLNGYNSNGSSISMMMPNGNSKRRKSSNGSSISIDEEQQLPLDYKQYSIDEIINGTSKFPGLIRLVIKVLAEDFLPQYHCDSPELHKNLIRIKHYLLLISGRAKGTIPTTAHWIRHKVLQHREYKQDSKINQEINFDILNDVFKINEMNDRKLNEQLLGEVITDYLFGESQLDG